MQNHDRSHVEELAHLYVDGAFDRRELLRRVAHITGSLAAATVALGWWTPISANAANPYFTGAPANFTYAQLKNAVGHPLTNAGGPGGFPHSFGQAPSWTSAGKVLSGQRPRRDRGSREGPW